MTTPSPRELPKCEACEMQARSLKGQGADYDDRRVVAQELHHGVIADLARRLEEAETDKKELRGLLRRMVERWNSTDHNVSHAQICEAEAALSKGGEG
jgi:hypothetical protein